MPLPHKLTIGIPTYNRAERLQRAIQAAIGQSMPCNVVVADDSDDDHAERLCKPWTEHPNFTYLRSPAKKLWHNWRWVAERAYEMGSEYFMWLQDDDIIRVHTARRIVKSMDRYPGCSVWCSNLRMGYDNLLGQLWVGNWGPKIPVDIWGDSAAPFAGKLLTPIAYVDSWSMSPAKAFRCGEWFPKMISDLPDDCDMFTERLDIAYAGLHGEAICDPVPAGIWIIHDRNESQHTGHTCPDQVKSAYAFIDTLMDRNPSWREELLGWIGSLGTLGLVIDYARTLANHKHLSCYASQIYDILAGILEAHGQKVPTKDEPKEEAGKAVAA